MMHKPIQIKDLDLSFPHKTCFENFSCQIPYGSRIAIIGRNGSGKSSLLKMIGAMHQEDVVVGYGPQVIEDHRDLSGGQRLNKAVTKATSLDPNVLLLDEPTNHLDHRHKKSLMRMLQNYPGTLVMVSHDKELLRQCADTLWHIDRGKVHIFLGHYDDYMHEMKLKRASIEGELEFLHRQKKDMHHKLMQEQQRSSKSKARGQKSIDQRKWPTVVSNAKAGRAEETSGRKKSAIDHKKQDLTDQLSTLRLPEMIVPKFSLKSADIGGRTIVSISEGSVVYGGQEPCLHTISLLVGSRDRIAIQGDNGSGKTTLIKAILGDESVCKTGEWHVVKREDVGYLDQHYANLQRHCKPQRGEAIQSFSGSRRFARDDVLTVLETIADLAPHWPHTEIRRHLNDFLFRKNEEVNALVSTLSGGEKARLSLAQIAAKTPQLLILDEITNNLDLETKDHVIQVLKTYPGAMIVISHDADFLEEIGVNEVVNVGKFK